MIDISIERDLQKMQSRPWHMRQELGPMMHELGHEMYDELEEAFLGDVADAPADQALSRASASPDQEVAWDHVGHIMTRIGSYVGDYLEERLSYKTSRPGDPSDILAQYLKMHPKLTYLTGVKKVVDEGLMTGIVMPVQLYRYVQTERRVSEGVFPSKSATVQPTDIARFCTLPAAITMLHQLAHAPNGKLGGGSTEPDKIVNGRAPAVFETPLRRIEFSPDNADNFNFNPEFLAVYRSRALAENRSARSRGPEGWSKVSGGCPVRHSEFGQLGSFATEFAEKLEVQGNADPFQQGESLITRGARFIGVVLPYVIEHSEAAKTS